MTLPGDTLQPLTIHYMIFPHIIIHCSPLLHIYCTNASHIFHRRFTDNSHMLHIHFTYTSHTLSLYITHIAHALQIYVQHSLTKLHLSLLHIALHHIDITLTSPDFTRMGRSKGEQEKKRHSCAHSCCHRSRIPIQAYSLPSACRAESCLLCC